VQGVPKLVMASAAMDSTKKLSTAKSSAGDESKTFDFLWEWGNEHMNIQKDMSFTAHFDVIHQGTVQGA